MVILGRLVVAVSVAWLVVVAPLGQSIAEGALTVAFWGCGWVAAVGSRD